MQTFSNKGYSRLLKKLLNKSFRLIFMLSIHNLNKSGKSYIKNRNAVRKFQVLSVSTTSCIPECHKVLDSASGVGSSEARHCAGVYRWSLGHTGRHSLAAT